MSAMDLVIVVGFKHQFKARLSSAPGKKPGPLLRASLILQQNSMRRSEVTATATVTNPVSKSLLWEEGDYCQGEAGCEG